MDVFDLSAKISLDTKDYENGLNSASEKSSRFGDVLKANLSSEILMGGLRALGQGIKSIGSAFVDITKQSVSQYSEYEQLVGGVQKLYGNMGMSVEDYAASVGKSVSEVSGDWQRLETAQNLVMSNAEQAYATAGMSMNEYMDTATSFSAALINSLGGDTIKAAEMTDVAMRSISDNFNTFGGDIGMIRGAFQGFAKQNYTMLDNLKLGYGGTKTEMERLIADANEYAKTIGETSDMSIDSFADIVRAIDLVQRKQNIAGTTAREAATTIQGSLGMLRSAWDNLLTGLSDADADISQLVDNVISSAKTVISNVMPAVSQAISSMATLITEVAPVIMAEIPNLIQTILPELLSGVQNLISSIAEVFPDLLTTFNNAIFEFLPTIVETLESVIPIFIETIANATPKIIESIANIIPKLIELLASQIPVLIDSILSSIPQIILALTGALPDIVISIVENIPQMVGQIADSVLENFPLIIGAIVQGLAEATIEIVGWFANLFTDVDEQIAGLAENINTTLAEHMSFGEWLEQMSPQIEDWTNMISVSGQTWSELDKVISDSEASITQTMQTAMQEQGEIRQQDIDNINKYLEDMRNAYEQKIGIATSGIVGQVQSLHNRVGSMNEEEAAQEYSNLQARMDGANQLVEEGYNTRIEHITTVYQQMGQVGSEAYAKEIADADAWKEEQLGIIKDQGAQATSILEENAQSWITNHGEAFAEMNKNTKSFTTENMSDFSKWALQMGDKMGLFDSMKQTYLASLNEMDLEGAESFLSMANTTKLQMGEIDETTKQTAENILSSFKGKDIQMGEEGKNILLGLIGGMKDQIPELADTSEMSASEIVKAVESYLGISSPSRVMKEIGEFTMEGLVQGMKSKQGEPTEVIGTVGQMMLSRLQPLANSFANIGVQLMEGLAAGMRNNSSIVSNIASQAVSDAVSAARRAGDIHSPSRKMAYLGKMLMMGLGKGIEDNRDYAIDAMYDTVDGLQDAALLDDGSFDYSDGVSDITTITSDNQTEQLMSNILQRLDMLENNLYGILVSAIADGVELKWNDRELGRMVRTYA